MSTPDQPEQDPIEPVHNNQEGPQPQVRRKRKKSHLKIVEELKADNWLRNARRHRRCLGADA
jgi:hypothetical protein